MSDVGEYIHIATFAVALCLLAAALAVTSIITDRRALTVTALAAYYIGGYLYALALILSI